MRTRSRLVFSSLAGLALGLLGCTGTTGAPDGGGGPTDTPPVTFPDCEAIIDACHEVDPGTGLIHDCHEAAHDATSNAACAPVRAECVRMCEAIDGGLGGADGGHVHAVDGGADGGGGHAHGTDGGV